MIKEGESAVALPLPGRKIENYAADRCYSREWGNNNNNNNKHLRCGNRKGLLGRNDH